MPSYTVLYLDLVFVHLFSHDPTPQALLANQWIRVTPSFRLTVSQTKGWHYFSCLGHVVWCYDEWWSSLSYRSTVATSAHRQGSAQHRGFAFRVFFLFLIINKSLKGPNSKGESVNLQWPTTLKWVTCSFITRNKRTLSSGLFNVLVLQNTHEVLLYIQ